jgi:hypothetical protein
MARQHRFERLNHRDAFVAAHPLAPFNAGLAGDEGVHGVDGFIIDNAAPVSGDPHRLGFAGPGGAIFLARCAGFKIKCIEHLADFGNGHVGEAALVDRAQIHIAPGVIIQAELAGGSVDGDDQFLAPVIGEFGFGETGGVTAQGAEGHERAPAKWAMKGPCMAAPSPQPSPRWGEGVLGGVVVWFEVSPKTG